MAAPVPAPVSQHSDAAAPPFTLTDATRIIADDAIRPTADLASAAVHTATGHLVPVVDAPARVGDIVLRVTGSGGAESYELTVDDGGVLIAGADEAGLFYGVQTLAQLLRPTDGAWAVAATRITDAPRFAYRGLMLDVVRHFFPVTVVEALIDHAAALKLNVLHLHLTDDQGWRLQLSSRPELTARAAATAAGADPGGFYTKSDYARIVAHAAARHMIVVPEIDGPSHTHAVGVAYPELVEDPVLTDAARAAAADGDAVPRRGVPYTGVTVGFSSLKTRDEKTYDFLADVYGELAGMTPGPYLHIGGDETHSTEPADFAEYMRRVTQLVHDLGKTPVAWHEAGGVSGISDDTMGQYWGSVTPDEGTDDVARAFVRNGGRLIMSPSDVIYLDMKYEESGTLGQTWAHGPTTVEQSYRWEPQDVIAGLEPDDIAGVEAPLWTETVRTPADIDELVFPRLASAAEIGWSPRRTPLRTWDSFRERIGALAPLWRRQGIGFFPAPDVAWAADTTRPDTARPDAAEHGTAATREAAK